jgi:hypothetical protein
MKYILTAKKGHSNILDVLWFMGKDGDSDHYMVVAKSAVTKQRRADLVWRDSI